jgi:hypothetical protein
VTSLSKLKSECKHVEILALCVCSCKYIIYISMFPMDIVYRLSMANFTSLH